MSRNIISIFRATICVVVVLVTHACCAYAQAQNPPPVPVVPAPSSPPANPNPPTVVPPTSTPTSPTQTEQTPSPPPPAPTPPTVPTVPTPPTISLQDSPLYLSQKVALVEGHRKFYVRRKNLGFSLINSVADAEVAIDQTVLTKYLTLLKKKIDKSSVAATVRLIDPPLRPTAVKSDSIPRPAEIIPSRKGYHLSIPDSVDAIVAAINANSLATIFPIRVETAFPSPQTSDLTGIDSRIAHFVTHYDPTEIGRTVTVKRAIQICNGYVIAPGEIFSLNDVVGERTIARGFGIGKVFINGTMQDQVGGGMCQVATTLYNAALLADLTIIERHAHARTVPYIPAGGDATVYYGEKDFQFENNTQTPIYVSYTIYGTHCIADLYGKGQPGVRVTVVTEPTRLGERYYKGVLRRYVTVDGKTVNDYTSYSTYKWTPALDFVR